MTEFGRFWFYLTNPTGLLTELPDVRYMVYKQELDMEQLLPAYTGYIELWMPRSVEWIRTWLGQTGTMVTHVHIGLPTGTRAEYTGWITIGAEYNVVHVYSAESGSDMIRAMDGMIPSTNIGSTQQNCIGCGAIGPTSGLCC